MKESYRKGVANRPDLDPCEGGCKAALEALGRGTCRLGIPTVSGKPEGNTATRDTNASALQALRSRRPHACMETSRARTERPGCHPWPQGGGSVGEGDEL